MAHSALRSAIPASGVSKDDLRNFIQDWLLDCELCQHTKATVDNRQLILKKFLWFQKQNQWRNVVPEKSAQT